MFGFLKDKLKGAVNKFSKKVDEEAEVLETPEEEAIEKVEAIQEEETEIQEASEEIKTSDESLLEEKEEAEALKEELTEELENEKADSEKKLEEFEDEKEKTEKEVSDAEDLVEALGSKVSYAKEKGVPCEVESAEEFEKELDDIEEVSKSEDTKDTDISDLAEEVDQVEANILEKEKEIREDEDVLEKVAEDAPPEEKEIAEAAKEEIEKELEEERAELEEKVEEVEEKKTFFKKLFKKKSEDGKEEAKEDAVENEDPVQVSEEVESVDQEMDEEPKKKGIFGKIREGLTKKVSEEKFEEFFWDIEVALLENNASIEVVEKIKEDMKGDIVGNQIPKSKVVDTIVESLKSSLVSLFDVPKIDLIKKMQEKKPYVISFIGVNGSGKTTNLAKVARKLQDEGKSVVIAACDTFRAAAIQQLEEHADKLGVKIIKHDYGADAAAVAFDAIEHAKAKGIDAVLIDTAGRLHSNENLMAELSKLMRVANPDLNIFVGESITGNDCVEQATKFGEAVRIDGIILTKADVDDKGGAAISISYVTGKPIIYIGVGQEHTDLKEFDSKIILDSLDL